MKKISKRQHEPAPQCDFDVSEQAMTIRLSVLEYV
jgi:hypothetical protein